MEIAQQITMQCKQKLSMIFRTTRQDHGSGHIARYVMNEVSIYLLSIYCFKLEGRMEMFYLTMHSTHFIYSYMVSDIWLRTILIVRKERNVLFNDALNTFLFTVIWHKTYG